MIYPNLPPEGGQDATDDAGGWGDGEEMLISDI